MAASHSDFSQCRASLYEPLQLCHCINNFFRDGGFMRLDRLISCGVLAFSVLVASPAFAQAAAKSVVKSITVYKTPT